MNVRIGVRRKEQIKPAGMASYGHEFGVVEGPPTWVELNGRRVEPDEGLLSVAHEATSDGFGIVTLKFLCTGYETVGDEEQT